MDRELSTRLTTPCCGWPIRTMRLWYSRKAQRS